MISRTARLFASEMTKLWRTKFPYLGLVAAVLMALIARQSVETMGRPGQVTAANFFTASINMSTTVIIPIFATIFAAMLVASETSRGTLRTILTRSVGRADFLSAKLLVGILYLFLLLAANIITASLIAQSYPLTTPEDINVEVPGLSQQIGIFSFALLLTIIPQIATVCFGFFVSVLARNVATSIGVAVGILLSIQPIKELVRFGTFKLSPWLFLNYYDSAMFIAENKATGIYATWNDPKIHMLLATSIISSAAFIGLSFMSFIRRDLNG